MPNTSMSALALRTRLFLVCACGWILWGCHSPAFGQTRWQRDEFWRVLPDNTVAAALIPDVELLIRHLSDHPALLRILSTAPSANIRHLGASWFSARMASNFADLRNMLRQVGVVVILKNDHAGADHPASASWPYEFGLLADIADPEHWQSLWLEKILPALQTTPAELELGVLEFQGETLYRITSLDFQLYYTMLEHTFLAARDRDTLQNLVLEFQKDTRSATAQQIASAVGDSTEADLVLTINLPILWPSLRSSIVNTCSRSDATLLTTLIDAHHWPIAAWQATIGDDLITEHLRLWYPPAASRIADGLTGRRNGFGRISSQNLPFVSDRVVSDHIVYYGARHLNLAALWREFLAVQEAAPETRLIRTIETWRTRIESTLQTSLEKMLTELGTLEIGAAWYPAALTQRRLRQPASAAQIPGLLMLHTDARAELARTLQQLPESFDLPASRSAFQDIEIVAYQVPFFGDTHTLFYAMVADVALFSWSEAIIKDAIRTARYGQALVDNQPYRFAAWPSRSLTRGYLNLARASANATSGQQASMLATLAPMLWATSIEAEGFSTTAHSPLGGPGVGVLLLWWTGFLSW